MTSTRTDLILGTVTALVDRLLIVDRENDDELPPGAIEQALIHGEVTVEWMAARFKQELGARLEEATGLTG